MLRKSVLAILAGSLLLTACQSGPNGRSQTDSWGGGETIGTLGGAAAGGLLGNALGGHTATGKAAGTLTGVLLGGFLGNRAGAMIDESDRAAAAKAEQRAYSAPLGQQVTWNNPQNGNSGVITPTRDGYDQNGAYCREFQQTITVGGKQQNAFGKACQQPDGSWKIVQ